MDFVSLKSRKSNFSSLNKVEEKCNEVGDIWTRIRGYGIFLYQYVRRNHNATIFHPWEINLGKLAVANIFVNVEFLKVIINKYNDNNICIYDNVGENSWKYHLIL